MDTDERERDGEEAVLIYREEFLSVMPGVPRIETPFP